MMMIHIHKILSNIQTEHKPVEVLHYVCVFGVVSPVYVTLAIPVKLCDPYWQLKLLPQCLNPFLDEVPVN